MQQIGTCDDEIKRGAMMEREKRLRGIVFLGGRSDYTPEELTMLNVPFVCCSYSSCNDILVGMIFCCIFCNLAHAYHFLY